MQNRTYSLVSTFKRYTLVFSLFIGTLGASAANGIDPGSECALVLHKALTLMHQVYDGAEGHVRWSVQNSMAGEDGTALVEELSWQKTKTRYKNQYMFLYRDGKEEVLILHDQQLILIRKQADFDKEKLMPAASQADTLIGNASSVTCSEREGKKSTMLLYDERVNGQYNPIKAMNISCSKRGELKVMELLIRKDRAVLTQRVEMLEMKKEVSEETFKYKARQLVIDSHNNLLPQYRTYEVVDWKH